MPRTIWKFTLAPVDEQEVEMPTGAKLLTVAAQLDKVCVWAEVDPAAPMSSRRLRVVGTGHPLPEQPGDYIGSAILYGGSLVFHIYDASR